MHLEEILKQHRINVSALSLPEYQRAGKDHSIYLLQIPESQALAHWEALRDLVPETGYWPVIGWDRFTRPPWQEEPVQTIVEAGLHMDVQQWLEQEWRALQGENQLHRETRQTRGGNQPLSSVTLNLHLRWVQRLAPIALVPTRNCWEVPAYLTAQANEWDPPDAVHVALLKYWHERWKAEVVSLNTGMMEMRVRQPPTTFTEALVLAKEQYVYAPDLVDQGPARDIYHLAGMLIHSQMWYFWWD